MKELAQKIRCLLAKSSPGPWQTRYMYRLFRACRCNQNVLGLLMGSDNDWNDSEIMTEMCNNAKTIAEALERLDTAEALLKEARQYVNGALSNSITEYFSPKIV